MGLFGGLRMETNMAESEVECFSAVKQLKIAKRKVELTEKKNIKT